MTVRQQIVESRVQELSSLLNLTYPQAFMRFAHFVVTGQSIHQFDDRDLVDGGQDKQVDTVTLEPSAEEADIFIIGCKSGTSHSSNDIILLKNGLEWMFNKSRSELGSLANTKFRDKILEYRSLQNDLGASNIRIHVRYVTNGDTKDLSDECNQEAAAIISKYDNETFGVFSFRVLGADELVAELNRIDRKERKVNVDLPFKYDTNNPSLIRYHAGGLKGVVCSVAATDIASLVNEDQSGYVFESNIRRFLGTRGGVNAGILDTCTAEDRANLFWFLNNGITIVCENFDVVTDPDSPIVKISGVQIINGCQTASSLAFAAMQSSLRAGTRVLVRIYQSSDPELAQQLVLTTNSQNKISSRDLHANDRIQTDLEIAFRRYDLLYERKHRQYDSDPSIDVNRIVTNEYVAQAVLGIVLRKPGDARRRKYKVWAELYHEVFSNSNVERFVIATLIAKQSDHWLKASGLKDSDDDLTRKLANNANFHVARIAAFIWRNGDDWADSQSQLEQARKLQHDSRVIDHAVQEAFSELIKVFEGNSSFSADVDLALRSTQLEHAIDSSLYRRARPRRRLKKVNVPPT